MRAAYSDKAIVVAILVNSFNQNQSVNYVVKQDSKREARLRALMEYSFDVCLLFGDVFLTTDKKGCVLVIYPDKKKTTPKSILLDVKMIFNCMGLSNLKKAINREAAISTVHPSGLIYYLWFIGVNSINQNKGIGSQLLQDVILEGQKQNRTICLETSALKNLPWYEKFGFSIYHEFDFGYKLYCLKKE